MPRLAALTAVMLLPLGAAAAEPGPERQASLVHLLRQDCGSCHGLTLKGGLGPPLLPAELAGRDDFVLVDTILDGHPGTPMPPWRFEMTPDEAAWLVGYLRRGAGDAH